MESTDGERWQIIMGISANFCLRSLFHLSTDCIAVGLVRRLFLLFQVALLPQVIGEDSWVTETNVKLYVKFALASPSTCRNPVVICLLLHLECTTFCDDGQIMCLYNGLCQPQVAKYLFGPELRSVTVVLFSLLFFSASQAQSCKLIDVPWSLRSISSVHFWVVYLLGKTAYPVRKLQCSVQKVSPFTGTIGNWFTARASNLADRNVWAA